MTQKTDLRRHWLEIRKSLSWERRKKGAEDLCFFLKNILNGPVLSFSSFGSEIETHTLNAWLAKQGILFLPGVEGSELCIHLIQDLELDLQPSKWGILEPNIERCPKIDFQTLETVLVPGLAFDSSHYRLGYGQGHYDRFLARLTCQSIGIAFHEQKTDILVRDSWDIPLQKVIFF